MLKCIILSFERFSVKLERKRRLHRPTFGSLGKRPAWHKLSVAAFKVLLSAQSMLLDDVRFETSYTTNTVPASDIRVMFYRS